MQQHVPDPDGNIAGDWSFRRCANPDCGVCWLDPAPSKEELWRAYASYHTHTRKSTGKVSRAMLSLFHRLLKLALLPAWQANGLRREANDLRYMMLAAEPAGRLLDVGCGAGRLLNRMKKRGWEVEGVDFDPQAARRVTERYGIPAHVGDLVECALPAASFDAIVMSQAVEHLYDPRGDLLECLRLLKPGGLLVMTTPNVDSRGAAMFGAYWRGWEPPRHLHLFSVDALRRLAEAAGFEIAEARTISSGAAVVYRASREIRETHEGGASNPLAMLVWSYAQEVAEHRAVRAGKSVGQNLLVRARKPLN